MMREGDSLRFDKWLWHARFAKTRSMAARLIEQGEILLGGRTAKPHHPVRIGDRIAVLRGRIEHRIEVRALGVRRGPPAEARLLYIEASPPRIVPNEAWEAIVDLEM
jgi:ribosome-associated heat shock protein Hsp15